MQTIFEIEQLVQISANFFAKIEQLSKLNRRYNENNFECIVIYGRRRVGKTALINEFCKDKPTIFFSALNSTVKENLETLSRAIEVTLLKLEDIYR